MRDKRTETRREVGEFSSFHLSLSTLSAYLAAESTESLVKAEHCFWDPAGDRAALQTITIYFSQTT